MSKKGGDKGGKEKEISILYKELAALRPSSDFEPSTEDYEKAIKVCNKLLNLDQSDSTAFHCKIVAMVQAGKFTDCLKQLENSKYDLDLQFEAAYCHYRLNDPHKAMKVLDGVIVPQVKHSELRAQVLYRLEQYENCFSVYRDIIKSSDDKYETERKTNLSAVTAQLGDKAKMVVDETDTFEQRYNAGCNYASVGDYEKAEKVLVQAEKAARNFLEEDEAGEDEILEETGIIKVQLGFVMQKQGRDKEAQTIYNQVLKNKPSDIGLVAVASNNLLTINKDQNIFDSKKRIKSATVEGLELKLTSKQRGAIARNNALLAMFTAQVDLCKELVSSLDSATVPDKDLIIAGALSKAGKHSEAVSTLMTRTNPDHPLTLLTCGQIQLTAGQLAEATDTLSQLTPDWKYRVGVLSTLVCLHLAMDDRQAAAELLKAAVEWNKKSGSAKSSGMAIVWRKTAEFHLKSGEAQVAAESLEELQKLEPGLSTLAQLVLAYARFDLTKALAVSKKLPPFSAGSVEVDSLESGSWAMGAKQFKKTPRPGGEKTPKTGTDDAMLVNKKKKQKKKKRLPKNYNPNTDPDPERWLPKRERTGLKYMPGYRKPRKDKRKAEKFTGAQGTDQGKSEIFDYSNKIAGVKDAAAKQASPVPEPAPGPRLQKGPGRTQTKKKKGGKNKF
eukprot:GFUD01003038.1.p1 GENE.GFUD01003038.1~~GFUD01003038.1.p1  ORF type:complete len:670 (+),score=255.64 GFUD01003038.1:44-2053(+)